MRQLPLFTVLLLVAGILAWNFSFYGDFYRAQSAGRTVEARPSNARIDPLVPGDPARGEGSRTPGLVDPATQTEQGTKLVGPDEDATSDDPSDVVPVEHFYASGAKKTEGFLRDGLRHGIWTEYWENGQVLMTGECVDGLRVGTWTWRYEDGSLRTQGDYEEGLKVRRWQRFHDNGRLRSEGEYVADEQGKLWRVFYRDGSLMESGQYVDGVRQGYWEFFDKNGEPGARTGTYVDGRLRQ